MRILLITAFLMFFVACSDTHNIKRADETPVVLDSSATAYVSVPADGRYQATVYPDSGRMTAFEVTRAFSPHLVKTTQGPAYESQERALAKARDGNYRYLIQPEILNWEDRATAWSMLPDQVRVKISVIDVATGEVLDSAVIEGKSTSVTLETTRPQALLEEPLTSYAKSLFR